MGKESNTDNEIVRGVEFEEERLTRVQRLEDTASTGLPEIDLVDSGLLRKEGKPVIVSDADITLHSVYPRYSSSGSRTQVLGSRIQDQVSVYFLALPLAFSTGYFFSLIASFSNMTSEGSKPKAWHMLRA